MEFMKARGRGGKRRAPVGPKLVLAAALALRNSAAASAMTVKSSTGINSTPKTENVKVGSSRSSSWFFWGRRRHPPSEAILVLHKPNHRSRP